MRVTVNMDRASLVEALAQYQQTALPSALIGLLREAMSVASERLTGEFREKDQAFIRQVRGELDRFAKQVAHAEDAWYLEPAREKVRGEVAP